MSYIKRNLQPGESVVYETKIHWIVYGRAIVAAALTATACYFWLHPWRPEMAVVFEGVAVLFLFVTLLEWLRGLIRRMATELAITDRRIIVKSGIIRRRTYEMNRSKVESVAVVQGIVGRLLDYGSIIIKGTGGGLEPLYGIDRPLAFRNHVTAG
jgi:uncharacterized membrane protein YdbT with pleckstrin-like domain